MNAGARVFIPYGAVDWVLGSVYPVGIEAVEFLLFAPDISSTASEMGPPIARFCANRQSR